MSLDNIPTTSKPNIPQSNVYTINITDQFRYATSVLSAGALVKDDQFTLFEAVGALEIGDPKMDSGCLDDGENIDHEYDLNKELLPGEVIWLMDELLSREVAWHMGYPLSQTLFTSVYIDSLLWPDPVNLLQAQFSRDCSNSIRNPLLHKVFRTYCLGLIKSCDLAMQMIKGQHYYEEEDFATQLFHRDLLHRFPTTEVLDLMADALSWITSTELNPETSKFLHSRMLFRYELLKMLSGHSGVPEYFSNSLTEHLDSIENSAAAGLPVPTAFSPKIQRRLASTIPPRPMVTIDRKRTLEFWRQSLKDMTNAFSVIYVTHSNDLMTAFATFNAQIPQPSAYVRALMQSFLSRGNRVCGIVDVTDFIIQDIRSLALPGSDILRTFTSQSFKRGDVHLIIRQHILGFVSKIEQSYLNIFRTLSLNRCRMRRTLCHAAIEWDQIQVDAEGLDEELQGLVEEQPWEYPHNGPSTYSYSLTSWCYHYKLIQIRLIVQMGFELSVYAPQECAGMYWYLSHVCGTHLAHLERISFFISKREAALPILKYRSAADIEDGQECRESLQLLYRHFGLLKATESSSRALHLFYTMLERQGQFAKSASSYASDQLRFELRMRPFLHLSIPEPVTFTQFEQASRAADLSDTDLLSQASVAATAAKKGWEEVLRGKWNGASVTRSSTTIASHDDPTTIIEDLWTSQIRGATKATIATSIAIGGLKQHLSSNGLTNNGSRKMSAQIPRPGDKDYWHPWWLVPRLSYS